MQTFENHLLHNYSTKFLVIAHTYIIGEIIAKDNLNIANLLQTLGNLLLLQKYSTEIL